MEDKKDGSGEFTPGATIHPGDASPTESPPPSQAVATDTQPESVDGDQVSELRPSVSSQKVEAKYVSDDPNAITWTASEFADHDKSFDWYLSLAVAAILAGGLLYLLFRDIITSITPLVAALALGFYARRKPRQLQYKVDSHGITIANKFYPYGLFRSFAIMDEGAFTSVAFLPLKRFGLLTTVYLDPQHEDPILDLISEHLPLEPRDHDMLDRFMNRIRF